MKSLILFLAVSLCFFSLTSCDGLNEKERAVVGAWSQSLVLAKLYFDMKPDKTFEAFAQSNAVKGVVVKWKGSWKVEGDQLKTDISEGPTVVTGLVDAKVGNILEKFGLDNDKIAFRGKILAAETEQLTLDLVKGVKVKWQKADAEKMEKLKKKNAEME